MNQNETVSTPPPVLCEIIHRYGPNIHILDDPFSLSLLARLSDHRTGQPDINRVIARLYGIMLHVVIAREFPKTELYVQTRLIQTTPAAVWRGQVIAPKTPVIVAALSRAGLLPANDCFESLNDTMSPDGVRQDHIMINRVTDDKKAVVGARISGAKIGGRIEEAILLIPDPMGATGSTVIAVLDRYSEEGLGRPLKAVAMHLIITPEYIRNVLDHHPETLVYGFRLDRGLSPEEILSTVPGMHWDQERGLTDTGYIVPGIGGLGELMNNAYV